MIGELTVLWRDFGGAILVTVYEQERVRTVATILKERAVDNETGRYGDWLPAVISVGIPDRMTATELLAYRRLLVRLHTITSRLDESPKVPDGALVAVAVPA